jgi:hypothetical protein
VKKTLQMYCETINVDSLKLEGKKLETFPLVNFIKCIFLSADSKLYVFENLHEHSLIIIKKINRLFFLLWGQFLRFFLIFPMITDIDYFVTPCPLKIFPMTINRHIMTPSLFMLGKKQLNETRKYSYFKINHPTIDFVKHHSDIMNVILKSTS